MKKIWVHFYNFILSLYMILCCSFFYKQYLTVVEVNSSSYSDFVYFAKDNLVLIVLFFLILFSILFNLFYICEYLVFTTREEIKIKRVLGYTYIEIVKLYYFRFISMFSISITIASLISILILVYFSLPILIPLIISISSLFIIISSLLTGMVRYFIYKFEIGKNYELKYATKIVIIFQFSISLMLILISIILFNDVNTKLSPYRNYVALENTWMLKANVGSVEKSMEIDKNPREFHENIISKIEKIYTTYEDNIMVYYHYSMTNKDIGDVIFLNEKTLLLNNVDPAILEKFLDSKNTPIILNNDFYGVYSEGDLIENGAIDYIVAKVLKPNKEITVLGPVAFVEDTSKSYNFALYDNKFMSRDLRIGNNNFLHTMFFYNLDKEVMQDICDYLNEPNFEYKVESIIELQEEYYLQKMIAISGYFAVGLMSFLVSIFGFFCVIYVDIWSKELSFSIMRVVGYSNKEITIKYLYGVLLIIVMSYINALILASTFLKFSLGVSLFVLLIMLLLASLISLLSYKTIKSIRAIETIGGTNV